MNPHITDTVRTRRRKSVFPLPIGLLTFALMGGCAGEAQVATNDDNSTSHGTAAQVAGAPSYTYCAKEGELCRFEGTRTVRYGENGVFYEKEVTAEGGGVWCINDVFGDPIYVVKHCDLVEHGGAPTHTPGDGSTREPSGPSVEGAQAWSNPATWGGRVPSAGESVTIPQGRTILLDADTPPLGTLTIHGTLIFDRRDVALSASGIVLHGTLAIGSTEQPFTQRATITLTGGVSDDQTSRGLVSMGGSLLLYGSATTKGWTTLDDHANASTNRLTLADDVAWHAGDRLIVAPTDFYDVMPTEQVGASEVSGRSVTLTQSLQHTHWGKLQYLTASGISLTPGTPANLPDPGVPTTVDERAEVANLTRNIVIQGADDAAWRESGFGAHVMIMGQSSQTSINGVELRRVGQSGRQARYPVHFHQLSYSGGREIPKGGSRVVRNSAIWNSTNRCITVHGTNEVTLDGNVCFDIQGHAVFLEDAVERRNVITNNLVLKVRPAQRPLLKSDQEEFDRGPSGFWLTNPDNVVTGNHAADAVVGFWMAFPARPLGLNKQVPILPQYMKFGTFSDNTSHSHKQFNIQLDWAPYDDAGSTNTLMYFPTDDEQPHDVLEGRNVRFNLDRISTWKGRGVWNRPVGANISNWVSADNYDMFFQGGGNQGRIRRVLAVAETNNNATAWQKVSPNQPPTAFASYHSEYNMQDNVLVNFKVYPGPEWRAQGGTYQSSHGGMLETKDYYITPVDLGPVYISNNLLINSHPGFRVRKPDAPGQPYTLAGALWDPYGLWGPKENYWVYDMPFLTSGTSCKPVDPAGENSQSCVGPYYGLHRFSGNDGELKTSSSDSGYPLFIRRMDVRREDANGREIQTWTVRDGKFGNQDFRHMRHAALVKGGRFVLEISDESDAEARSLSRYVPHGEFLFELSNFKRPDDELLLAIPFAFSKNERTRAYVSSYHVGNLQPDNPGQLTDLVSVNSLAEVQAGNGERMWHDEANQRVWIKVKTPPVLNYPPFDPNLTDLALLHRGLWVRLFTCSHVDTQGYKGNDAALQRCH